MEDWFGDVCPSVPIIDLAQMPECSQSCIWRSIIPAYCRRGNCVPSPCITKNCFCRLGSGFPGFRSCLVEGCNVSDSQALSISRSYYDKNCVYNLEYPNGAGPDNSLTTGTGSGANTQQSNNGAGAFKEV
ncbi:MAG: hypothetical protein M1813_008913, partial [Trichoglossum hirsutum]